MQINNIISDICQQQAVLKSFALGLTKNTEDAHDLLQETLIKAIRYQSRYQYGTNLRAWLFTIMRNTFINCRRREFLKRAAMDVHETLCSHHLSAAADFNLGEDRFIQEDVDKALRNLPEECAKPFLRYFQGYKYKEIADEMKMPIGTVKTRIHNARKLLKSQLKMYENNFLKSAS